MRRNRFAAVSVLGLLLLPLLFVAASGAQATREFTGRVFDAQSKKGIANLEVKLRPPSNSSAAIMIGTTDPNGMFRFPQVKVDTYLVEVSQGPYLLYRGEADVAKTEHVEIPVQHR